MRLAVALLVIAAWIMALCAVDSGSILTAVLMFAIFVVSIWHLGHKEIL